MARIPGKDCTSREWLRPRRVLFVGETGGGPGEVGVAELLE